MRKKIIVILCYILLACNNVWATKKANTLSSPIETITAKTIITHNQISVTGTIISVPSIVIRPEISGRITKIFFNSGDIIQKGSPLIEINPDLIKAKLIEAIAKEKLAKLQLERYTTLVKTYTVSKAEFDKTQADYAAAQAQVKYAQAKLQQTKINAPFTGKLGFSNVNLGDYVSVGQNIVNLQTINPLTVDFSIPDIYFHQIKPGQIISLNTNSYPQETFIGKIEAIDSLINQNNRTLKLRANVPNKDNKLIPGGFAEITLKFPTKQISIPYTAITYTPTGNYVFKIIKGQKIKTQVILGKKDKNDVIILSGIQTGDIIVADTPKIINTQKEIQ